jgi:hypothetical protein
MTNTTTTSTVFTKNDTVRPACDGEDARGSKLKWTKLRGKVVTSWVECGETRVEVRWFGRVPYPTIMPGYLLEKV